MFFIFLRVFIETSCSSCEVRSSIRWIKGSKCFCHQSMDIFAPFNVDLPSTHGVTLQSHVPVGSAGHEHNGRTGRRASWPVDPRNASTVQSKLGPGSLTAKRAASRLATRVVLVVTGSNQIGLAPWSRCCEVWGNHQQMKWEWHSRWVAKLLVINGVI